MTMSIGEKKRVSGVATPIVWLEEYHQCRGMTGGIKASELRWEANPTALSWQLVLEIMNDRKLIQLH